MLRRVLTWRPKDRSEREMLELNLRQVAPRNWRQAKRFCLLMLMVFSPYSNALDAITLDGAINTALSNNPTLKQLRLQTGTAELSIGVARSEFEFSLRPEGGVRLDKGGDENDFYGLRLSKKTIYGSEVSISGVSESLIDSGRQNRFTLELSQPLFRFAGALINEEVIIQAKQSRRTVLRDLELSRSRIVVSVVEAYEQVLRLKKQLAADQQALLRAESLYKLTVAKERLGRTTRIDTLRVQLQQGQTLSRAQNTREQLASEQRALGELMGLDNRRLPDLTPAPFFQVKIGSVDEAIATALNNRLDYAQAQQQYEDTRRASRISKRSLLPSVKLVAHYEHADDELFFDQDLNDSKNTWYLSLVSDTDFNQSREKLEYRQSLQQQDRALEQIRAVHLSISREVEQRLLAYRRAHLELEVLEGNFQHAGARLKLARQLFRIGRTDGFSVTDAEQAYFTAQSSLLTGKSEASVNGYRLLNAMGTLIESPDHLKPRQI